MDLREFETCLVYIERPCLQKQNKKPHNKVCDWEKQQIKLDVKTASCTVTWKCQVQARLSRSITQAGSPGPSFCSILYL